MIVGGIFTGIFYKNFFFKEEIDDFFDYFFLTLISLTWIIWIIGVPAFLGVKIRKIIERKIKNKNG